MSQEEFVLELKKLGIELTEHQEKQLKKYYEMLVEYNKHMNLTGITEKSDVYLKHFYDSLTLEKAIHLEKMHTLCDIGTGAGFPGLVLKIVFPNLKVTLVDSLNKRILFLQDVITELGLTEIEAKHVRAEEFAKLHREEYDIVTSRAVANLSLLSEISLPLVRENGYFIPMKGNLEIDITTLNSIIKKLNGKLEEIISFDLPNEHSVRNLLKIRKIDKTNLKYPRKFSDIKKKPLQ